MAKFIAKIMHKDAMEDHAHKVPETGTLTGGMIMKPSAQSREMMHTHLYEYHGKSQETMPAPIGPGHEHESEAGVTGGPVALPKESTKPLPRKDSDEIAIHIGKHTFYWENNPKSGQGDMYDEDGEHIGRAPSVAAARAFLEKEVAKGKFDADEAPKASERNGVVGGVNKNSASSHVDAEYKGVGYKIETKGKAPNPMYRAVCDDLGIVGPWKMTAIEAGKAIRGLIDESIEDRDHGKN